MRAKVLGLLIVSWTFVHAPVWAATSLGLDIVGGVGTSGATVTGSLDLPAEEVKHPFETSFSYAHLHSTAGTESRTNQYTLGLAHGLDEHWAAKLGATYWKDSVNAVHYAGATAGATYTWLEGAGATSKNTALSDTTQEEATTPPPKNEVAALSINTELNFYGTEVVASSMTRTVFSSKLHRLVKQTIPAQSTTEHETQFHPSLTVEKPFLDSQVPPYLTAGHYFYSRDPATLEGLVGRPRYAASANQINGLVGGFLRNNGEVGLRISLPLNIESDARLGAEQLVTDSKWATTQGVTLTRDFWHHLQAKFDWSRSIQEGISSDLFTGGLTYTF